MKNLASIALSTLFVTNLLVGCVGGDNDKPDPASGDDQMDTDPGQGSDPVATPIAFPKTCAEAKVGIANITDGEHILYLGGDEQKPWSAYCVDMKTAAPKEYLTLLNAGQGTWSLYTAGGRSPGTDVRTIFDKVRIDPLTLKVNVSDVTFSTSTGSLVHLGITEVTSMPLGVAMVCGPAGATASVDFTGTPFDVLDGQFSTAGDVGASGYAGVWPNGQVVEQWASGDCGYNAPTSFDPMSHADAYAIQLTYVK
ncbi:MAG TPA: GON domain-containing protein [Kofleriaceae bacterium]|jgi:hypothetical protein